MSFRAYVTVSLCVLVVACSEPPAEANGRFEATEITVSAEASGPLLSLRVRDGDMVQAGEIIGQVDTVLLARSRDEIVARAAVLSARLDEAAAQGRALATQQALAGRELARLERLAASGAATAQQVDRAQRDAQMLVDQLAANAASRRAVLAEREAIAAQQAQLAERLQKAEVRSPISGVVLARYAEAGEMVQAGTPLLKMASLDSLVLRAYLSDAQLRDYSVGQQVTVQVDGAEGELRTMTARVTWISPSAEFTPTPIQTRDERVSQVYAITVVVANPDGRLRIGMPGELMRTTAVAQE